jgi:hypothetical protein
MDQGSIAMVVKIHGANGGESDPVFAVWVGEGGGGSVNIREVPARTPGTLLRDHEFEASLAGMHIEFQTGDEKYGPVKIGSESFDLANGALFLVSKRNAKPEVMQMNLAKLNVMPLGTLTLAQATNEYFRALARTDPDINAFWKEPARTK